MIKTRKNIFGLLLILGLSLLLAACDGTTASPAPVSSGPNQTILPEPTQTVVSAATSLPEPSPTTVNVPTITPEPTSVPTATATVTALIAATPTAEATTVRPATTRSQNDPATATLRPTTPAPATTKQPPTATVVPQKTTAAATAKPNVPVTPYSGSLSEVVRGKTGKKQVAITLDAGAGAEPFPKMLKALDSAGVKITFFLTGSWAQQNSTFVQQIVNSGHEIANHTWSHPDLTTLSDAQIKDEIERTDALLSRFTGHSTRPLWRAPFGSRDARVTKVVNEMGYRSIYWTIDSLDSVGQPKSAKFLIDRITGQTDAQLDGEIILMHIGNATTADALPTIIQNLQNRGFKVVTVSQLIG
jgi:peptidoglycan/xylan/chitin deacetylase (PgdA/CDA1 family)